MRLFQQKTNCTCGAVCYSMIVDALQEQISEKQAVDECGTDKNGTHTYKVLDALKTRNIDAHLISLNTTFSEYAHWLDLTSKNRVLYLGCNFVNQGKRGRPSNRHHAIVASNGYIYDPGEKTPVPIEAYFDTYNKELYIDRMILIDIK